MGTADLAGGGPAAHLCMDRAAGSPQARRRESGGSLKDMAFLTIFSAPKPFVDPHVTVIQRNAVQAWSRLEDVDVILIGDEPGIPETAREFSVKNVPEVKRDEKGVPLVSSI